LYPGDVKEKNADTAENPERRIAGRDAISQLITTTGARTSTPSDTKPSAAAHPTTAHAENQRQSAP
jgi:hypothetical protein